MEQGEPCKAKKAVGMLSWSKCVCEVPPAPPATSPGAPLHPREPAALPALSTAAPSDSRDAPERAEEQLRPWVANGAVNSVLWLFPRSLDFAQLLCGCYHKAYGEEQAGSVQ